jgi:hypothetical protein
VYQIAAGVGKTDDKGRQRVGRCCRKLKDDGYIYKENKRANYHIAKKVYGYPELSAFSFGNQAIRTVCNIHRRLTNPPETALHQFATRIGALIEYVMIQALRPKKALPDREGFVELDASIKGNDKDSMSSGWIENAITHVNVKGIFVEFCRLWIVKRGLAVFADRGERGYINRSLVQETQKRLIDERKKMRKMNVYDPDWSPHEMYEENFKKLTDAFASAFPEIYEKLEKLRKELPAEIESNIEMVKEQMARIEQLERGDPHHTKCGGELVPETRYKCKTCGRSFLKN